MKKHAPHDREGWANVHCHLSNLSNLYGGLGGNNHCHWGLSGVDDDDDDAVVDLCGVGSNHHYNRHYNLRPVSVPPTTAKQQNKSNGG
jgi:hypothetical protein